MKSNVSILLLFLFVRILFAEYVPQKAFTNFTVKSGIPYASIEEIHFDNYQNLWFLGSNNQIYYFDGRNYFHLPLSFLDSVNVLNSMLILNDTIFITSQKKIYLVSDIYSSNPEEMQLSFLPEGEYTKIVQWKSIFYSINIDSNLLVYFDRNRLLGTLQFKEPLRYLFVNDTLMAISTDTRKIYIYRLETKEPEYLNTIHLNFLKKHYYIEPITLAEGKLYALINEYGIISVSDFTRQNYSIKSYRETFPKEANLHYILFRDKFDQIFWTAGFYEGLYRWQPGELVERIDERNGLGNNLVRFILQDNQNRLWLGTQNGISVLKNKLVTIYNKNSGLKDEFIWGINKIGNRIYFCTNAGMYYLTHDGTKFDLHPFNFLQSDNQSSFNFIEKTSEGIFFTTTQIYGLYQVRGNQIVSLKHLLKKYDSRLALYIYEDSKHRIWISGYDIGYLKNGKYTHLKVLPFSSDLKNRNIVYDIVESPITGIIYFAATNGLYTYDGRNINFYRPPYQHEAIYAQIEFDPWKNKILIGSEGKGLIEFDEKTHTFNYSGYNRLIKGKNVYNIRKMDSLLLVTTDIGLTAIPRSGNTCYYVNTKNGLISNETNTFGLEYDDQFIYLGTTDGLHILPRDLTKFQSMPQGQLYVKEIISDGQKIRWTGKSTIHLSSNEKHLKISLGYASYFDYSRPYLKYSITPLFKESKTTESWEIEFYNLPYGQYKLSMVAVSPEGFPVSHNTLNIVIDHAYPIYYSFKFYFGLAIILVTLVLLIIKLRTYRLEKLSRRLKKELAKHFEEISYLNQLLEKIIEKSTFGMILFDDQGNCVKLNESAKEYIQILTGSSQKISRKDFLHHLQMKLGAKIESDNVEISMRIADDRIWQLILSRIKHGKSGYDLVLLSDITDIIEKESIRKQMQAYQQVIATVSHYINNALSALQLKNEVVGNKYGRNPALEELSGFIHYTVKKITYILQTLDSAIQNESIQTTNYANIRNLLIDIEKHVSEFEEKNQWK